MVPSVPKTMKGLEKFIKKDEGPNLEFKRSTGELKEALQTLCAFLNGSGGVVIFGVGPKGTIEGQQVSDKTLREITQALDRFEPPVTLHPHRVSVGKGKEAIILQVAGNSDSIPFTYDGRAYERVSSSTRKMSKDRYEKILLERLHLKKRWENLPAHGITIKNIDREEVFRIIRIAESVRRFSGPIGRNVMDILNRLGLIENDQITQAAVVLFGNKFLPNYPQCELRMARFRGTDKTEFLDQRIIRGPAFKLLEESELFCQRHFPLPAKIVPTQLHRLETPLIPPDAMREILVNALIHRDYSIAGGAISLAIFDDRVEVWSAGTFPNGITPEKLSKTHTSIQRNPLIAETFNRAGLIEKWGRGTNRVIDMCKEAGIKPPKFEEITGAAVVTFQVNVLGSQAQAESSTQSTDPVPTQSTDPVERLLTALAHGPLSPDALKEALHLKHRPTFRANYLRPALERGLIEATIPDKPTSSKQKYRLTENGRKVLNE